MRRFRLNPSIQKVKIDRGGEADPFGFHAREQIDTQSMDQMMRSPPFLFRYMDI